MPKQKTTERKQPTPTGIPMAMVVAFCFVFIPTDNWVIPLGFVTLGYSVVGLMDQTREALIPVPFVILIIAELLRNEFWRSLLFTTGSTLLIVEWLSTAREIKRLSWIMFLTSLPFIVVVGYWNARSLNSIFRPDKRDTPIP